MTRGRRALTAAAGGALLATLLAGTLATAAPVTAAPGPCAPSTLKKDIKKADVVFRGVVTNAKPVRGKGDQRHRDYRVQVDRVYKSSLVTEKVTVTADVGTRCDIPVLKEDRRYLFFATEDGARLMATNATAPATDKLTRKVVAKLGDGVVPRPAPPATAEFSQVADASPPALSRVIAPGAALLIVSLLGLLVLGRVGRRHA